MCFLLLKKNTINEVAGPKDFWKFNLIDATSCFSKFLYHFIFHQFFFFFFFFLPYESTSWSTGLSPIDIIATYF